MSVTHMPKIYLNENDRDKHYFRLGKKRLDRKARKYGFTSYEEMKSHLNFLKELGQPHVLKALYVLDHFNSKKAPVVSNKHLSTKDLVRAYQGMGLTKRQAKAHLRGDDYYDFK